MSDAAKSKSVDPKEIANFAAMADEWWDETGKFKPLHKFNPIRIGYIRDQVIENFKINLEDGPSQLKPFKGLRFLDIGCGGGLLTEPMARLGAEIVAADASETNINVASLHSKNMGLEVDYRHTTAEDLAASDEKFDVILNMEVIEHVADLEGFAKACCQMLKPGGIMFIATLNRTFKSYTFAIIGAEYVLRWLPRGTHNWKKFLRPSEVVKLIRANGLSVQDMAGASYNPVQDSWRLSKDMSINYMLTTQRPQ